SVDHDESTCCDQGDLRKMISLRNERIVPAWQGWEFTENERAWIEFIRLSSCESDPVPTLQRVQKLRLILNSGNQR
ncbi:MAG: hypothetical protein WAU86_12765, partial [Oricola sp.]